jgi:hypothetical protein
MEDFLDINGSSVLINQVITAMKHGESCISTNFSRFQIQTEASGIAG